MKITPSKCHEVKTNLYCWIGRNLKRFIWGKIMSNHRTKEELLIDTRIKLEGALTINSYLKETTKSIIRKIMIQNIINGINKELTVDSV